MYMRRTESAGSPSAGSPLPDTTYIAVDLRSGECAAGSTKGIKAETLLWRSKAGCGWRSLYQQLVEADAITKSPTAPFSQPASRPSAGFRGASGTAQGLG